MVILRHILSILLLPVMVTVALPYAILSSNAPRSAAWFSRGPFSMTVTVVAGCLLAAGLALVCATVWQFATIGHGTLAPWDPPKRMVVAGVYRHVRNPMISGVLSILLGEALLFQSTGLLIWLAGAFALNATYIPLVEEPGLERRFGDEYREYKAHVPRWLPRATAWVPPQM